MIMEEIKNAVCNMFGITLESLNSNSHDGKIKRAQRIVVYVAHEITHIPYRDISVSFGKRDDAWAIFMNITASRCVDAELQFTVDINKISNLLTNSNRK